MTNKTWAIALILATAITTALAFSYPTKASGQFFPCVYPYKCSAN